LECRGEDRLRRLRRIKLPDAIRVPVRQLDVTGDDPVEELVLLAFETVDRFGPLARAGTPKTRVDQQQERSVGTQTVRAELVDRTDGVDPELSPSPLVSQRGVDEAIEQDPGAASEQRVDRLLYQLGARRCVEQ